MSIKQLIKLQWTFDHPYSWQTLSYYLSLLPSPFLLTTPSPAQHKQTAVSPLTMFVIQEVKFCTQRKSSTWPKDDHAIRDLGNG